MPSGWFRWLLEQFEFPSTVVYPQTLDVGDLKKKYDDILFSDGAITAQGRDSLAGSSLASRQPKPETIPAESLPWLGAITTEKTIPQLQKFVEEGGTLLAIGSSTSIYESFHLPLVNAVTEIVKGKTVNVSPEKFYIPGSLMRTRVNTESPVRMACQQRWTYSSIEVQRSGPIPMRRFTECRRELGTPAETFWIADGHGDSNI